VIIIHEENDLEYLIDLPIQRSERGLQALPQCHVAGFFILCKNQWAGTLSDINSSLNNLRKENSSAKVFSSITDDNAVNSDVNSGHGYQDN
jgi:hypothetical protein